MGERKTSRRGLVKSAELPHVMARPAGVLSPPGGPSKGSARSLLGNGVTVAQQTLTLFV